MLTIHPKCKHRLIERLAHEINNIQIEKGIFLIPKTHIGLFDIDKSLPDTRGLKSRLEGYIGEDALFQFCYSSISDIVSQQEKYDENRPTYMLTEVAYFQNNQEASEKIINDFISLPKKYVAIFEFNKEINASFEVLSPRELRNYDEYIRSEDIKLSGLPPELHSIYPKNRSLLGLLATDLDWQDKNVFLVINLEGFISKSGSTTPLHDCKSALKAFVGLALACDIAKKGAMSTMEYIWGGKYHEDIYVFSQTEQEWTLHRSLALDENIAALLHLLQIGLVKGSIFQWRLRLIEAAFQAREAATKIRLCAEWLCDSYANDDDLSSFVQATTALEILLGGSKEESAKIGVTDLLANRLAYLTARRPSDRENIMQKFRDIYDVRSRIVHSGKSRLNMSERPMLFLLRHMVGAALLAELTLLIKEDNLT